MIVYGFRSKSRVLGQTQYGCQQCQRNSYHGIVRSKRYFTLFWIPIFPVGTTTIARCQLCGYQEKVDNKRADEIFAHQMA